MAIYSDSGYITGVDFPLIRPTLDLNFAATKSLDRRITFTRDSIGTYADELGIVRYASNNVPRFDHDPTTGESLGLLVEESRTNLFTYSEDYTQSDWFKGRVGITANTTTSPDDTQTADLLTENNTSTGEHYIGQVGFNYTSGQSYTWSWYVKPNGRTNVYCKVYTNFNTANAILNLDTGTVYHVSAEQFDSTTYERLSNGWYRVSFTKTAISTGEGNVLLGFANSSTTYAYLGDGTSGMYYWGAQVEAGSFPTSYIPTSGSTVTRATDIAKIAGDSFSSFYNPTESTILVDVKGNVPVSQGGQRNIFHLGNDNSNGYGFFKEGGGLNKFLHIRSGGSTVSNFDSGVDFPYQTTVKFGAAFTNGDQAMYFDDVLRTGTATTTGISAANITALNIGASNTQGANSWTGTISKLSYYPKRLPNAQLQGLTQQ